MPGIFPIGTGSTRSVRPGALTTVRIGPGVRLRAIDEYDIESPPAVARDDHALSGSTRVLPPGDGTVATAESWMVDEIVEWGCCAVYDAAHFGVGCVCERRVVVVVGMRVLPESGDGDLETAVAEVPAERSDEQNVAEAVRVLLLPLSGESGVNGDGVRGGGDIRGTLANTAASPKGMGRGVGVGVGVVVAGVGASLCHFAVIARRDFFSECSFSGWREGEVYWYQKWGAWPSA